MRNLVQVILVVVILLIAGSLVAHGLLQVRAVADGMNCQNNLKQLAIALHSYHESQKSFPAGTVGSPSLPPEKRLSWITEVWPYLECSGPLLLDREKAWDSDENRLPMEGSKDPSEEDLRHPVRELRVLMCPANPNRTDPNLPGVTHYIGIAGLGADAALLPANDPRAGVFGYDRRTKLEDVEGGTGWTLLLMETATANGPWTAGGPATVRGLDPEGAAFLGWEGQFSSRHRCSASGTNVVLVDGSVRAIRPSEWTLKLLPGAATLTAEDNLLPGGF